MPPDYVIMYYEADKLEAQGDFAGARAKREEAAKAKRAALNAGRMSKEVQTQNLPTKLHMLGSIAPAKVITPVLSKPGDCPTPEFVILYYEADQL